MNFARTAAVACLSLCLSHAAFAEDAGKPPSSPDTASLAFDANEPEGTPEERAERDARKACKVKICDIIATKDPQGDDVSCDIVKTWREADITKMLGSRLEIERKQLVTRRTTTWTCRSRK